MINNVNITDKRKMKPLDVLLIVLFVSLLSISLLMLKIFDVRPMIYYVTVTVIATIILAQILIRKEGNNPLIILAQIALLTVSIIWGMTLKYDYYIGRTDLLGHAWYVQNLLDSGHVTAVFDFYQAFPLWHILAAALYSIAGFSGGPNVILYLASGLVYFLLPVALYLVTMKLCSSQKIALLSALIISLSTDMLIYGMYSIPRSIVTFFLVVMLLILLARQATTGKRYVLLTAVALFFVLVITMYHTVSILFVLVILLAIYLLEKLLARNREKPLISARFFLASVGIVVAYWLAFALYLPQYLIDALTSPFDPKPISMVYTAPINELLNYIQYTPVLLFVILGTLIVLRSKKFSPGMKMFSTLALLFIPVTFPGPLLLIPFLRTFNVDRFTEYTAPFMGIIAAVGLMMLYDRKSKLLKTACVLIFVGWVFLSVSNDFVASDNPLVKRDFFTSDLKQSEVTGIQWAYGISTASTSYTLSDYVVGRYLQFSPYLLDDPSAHMYAEVYDPNGSFVKHSPGDIILLRDAELDKRPLKLQSLDTPDFTNSYVTANLIYYNKGDPVFDSLGQRDQIYNSSTVDGYV